jgi:hypothetical protein
MIAAPVVPFRKIDKLPANAGRPGEARQRAQPSGHLPIVIAVGKPGNDGRHAHEAMLANHPRPLETGPPPFTGPEPEAIPVCAAGRRQAAPSTKEQGSQAPGPRWG